MAAVRGSGSNVRAAAAVAALRAGGYSNRGGAALASDFAVDVVACAASASRGSATVWRLAGRPRAGEAALCEPLALVRAPAVVDCPAPHADVLLADDCLVVPLVAERSGDGRDDGGAAVRRVVHRLSAAGGAAAQSLAHAPRYLAAELPALPLGAAEW